MFAEKHRRRLEILLVEDSNDDADFILKALSRVLPEHQIHWARDAGEALDFVHQRGEHADAPHTDLVLLDLHLPQRGGYQVLEDIKTNDVLRSTPVVVISGSDDESDVRACYAAQANSYVRKPTTNEEFDNLIASVHAYWVATVQLPTR